MQTVSNHVEKMLDEVKQANRLSKEIKLTTIIHESLMDAHTTLGLSVESIAKAVTLACDGFNEYAKGVRS